MPWFVGMHYYDQCDTDLGRSSANNRLFVSRSILGVYRLRFLQPDRVKYTNLNDH
jgi:hypothetical protein